MAPTPASPQPPLPRAVAPLASSPPWARFIVDSPKYAPQYAHIYFCRLSSLRSSTDAAAARAWGPASPSLRYADNVLSAAATPDIDAAVSGVVFRDAPNKPSILAEYAKTGTRLMPAPPPPTGAYCGGDIVLEDQTGRFKLDVTSVADRFAALATGFVVAVRGREDRKTGAFKVADFVDVGLAPQAPLAPVAADAFVCLVSGLGLGDARAREDANSTLAYELLQEYLRGNIGGEAQAKESAAIAHLIIAGNSCALPPGECGRTRDMTSFLEKAEGKPVDGDGRAPERGSASPIVYADNFFTAAAAALPVSVMPGGEDPANFLLPQQPFHRCLLPNASREKNLDRVTNPFEQCFGGRLFLGTAGQNVDDYAMYGQPVEADVMAEEEGKQDAGRSLDAMEAMLRGRHVAPTAPDTLGSYPFTDNDPFVMKETPHVFFAGNQSHFGSKVVEGQDGDGRSVKVRVLSVPRFDETGAVVLVNLRTLETRLVPISGAPYKAGN